ncbi:MAG: helix-turn-helix domain-containing protein [Chloroflexota bacterium]
MTTDHERGDPMADWISREEAAKLLRRSIRTVERMIDDGKIVAVKYGQQVNVLRGSIDDYVAKLEAMAKRRAAARAKANAKVPA